MKIIRTGQDLTSNVNNIRRFLTIDDLVIKNKTITVLNPKIEQKFLNYMRKVEERRILEEQKGIETAKKIFLNA